jgi:transcriptional regulator with XRE-family HTH domain
MISHSAKPRREQLRDFLRTRRERLTPSDVGMPTAGRRRTPGLRREEVAVLAGVGVSWYTWLEQGRHITVSTEVLEAIATALRLTGPERSHLYLLAGLNPPPAAVAAAAVSLEARQLVDAWELRPAMLRDRYWNVLASNDTARAVFGFGDAAHNCLITFFTHPWYRAMNDVWLSAAPAVVAAYRADAAHAPDDPEFRKAIDHLSWASPEFAELWQRHEVGVPIQAVNALRHPEAGELWFDAATLTFTDHPGWHLVLYNPRPDTDTAQRLARLVGTHANLVLPHPR